MNRLEAVAPLMVEAGNGNIINASIEISEGFLRCYVSADEHRE